MQVLVARDELTERARRQERLGRKQRSALVDVAHPATQPVATSADLDLRGGHSLVRRVDFGVDVGELLVERPEESRRRFPLPPDQDHFIGERAHASLDLARFGHERVALLADAIELVALLTQS